MEDARDLRVRRTRRVLTDAFLELIVERPYDEIAVGDIIERAGVGRSTFYLHHGNKHDILRQSLAPAFETLAETLSDRRDPARLIFWVETFWTNRRVGRVLLAGPTRALMARTLAGQIAPRLPDARTLLIPAPLAAAQVAEAQLGVIGAWLSGHSPCPAVDMAAALAAASRAIALGLVRRP
jgi:AcrR family transcriptional regulator